MAPACGDDDEEERLAPEGDGTRAGEHDEARHERAEADTRGHARQHEAGEAGAGAAEHSERPAHAHAHDRAGLEVRHELIVQERAKGRRGDHEEERPRIPVAEEAG